MMTCDPDWDIEDFSSWLKSLPQDKIVGFFRSTNTCPLAIWRISLGEVGSVTADFFWPLCPPLDHYRLPAWAKKFVYLGDHKCYVIPRPPVLLSILELCKDL